MSVVDMMRVVHNSAFSVNMEEMFSCGDVVVLPWQSSERENENMIRLTFKCIIRFQ